MTSVRRRGILPLLLVAALVLHAFMLAHGYDTDGKVTAASGADRADESQGAGHGHHQREADAGAMQAFCFSVLACVAAYAGLLMRPRLRANAVRATATAGDPPTDRGSPAWREGGRDGPRWAVPVDAGVLLRV